MSYFMLFACYVRLASATWTGRKVLSLGQSLRWECRDRRQPRTARRHGEPVYWRTRRVRPANVNISHIQTPEPTPQCLHRRLMTQLRCWISNLHAATAHKLHTNLPTCPSVIYWRWRSMHPANRAGLWYRLKTDNAKNCQFGLLDQP